jgi:hypothetical protein
MPLLLAVGLRFLMGWESWCSHRSGPTTAAQKLFAVLGKLI